MCVCRGTHLLRSFCHFFSPYFSAKRLNTRVSWVCMCHMHGEVRQQHGNTAAVKGNIYHQRGKSTHTSVRVQTHRRWSAVENLSVFVSHSFVHRSIKSTELMRKNVPKLTLFTGWLRHQYSPYNLLSRTCYLPDTFHAEIVPQHRQHHLLMHSRLEPRIRVSQSVIRWLEGVTHTHTYRNTWNHSFLYPHSAYRLYIRVRKCTF